MLEARWFVLGSGVFIYFLLSSIAIDEDGDVLISVEWINKSYRMVRLQRKSVVGNLLIVGNKFR